MIMNRFLYNIYCCIAWPFVRLVCPCRVLGRENIPSGAAIICANHSSNFDPPMLAIYFGFKHKMHFMSKAELLDLPILGFLLKQAGVFPVHRGENTDIQAIRTAMKILKNGEKVMMFPQGTRVLEG
ncbi:MAG: 1-acyl-sn-glycerol-3-phosphate acyltransferase, partial [Clostridia bacterium]|nr:1-acyl-sn-glycerol-3-phosphate acyltransferase [Clostridia bacterium]